MKQQVFAPKRVMQCEWQHAPFPLKPTHSVVFGVFATSPLPSSLVDSSLVSSVARVIGPSSVRMTDTRDWEIPGGQLGLDGRKGNTQSTWSIGSTGPAPLTWPLHLSDTYTMTWAELKCNKLQTHSGGTELDQAKFQFEFGIKVASVIHISELLQVIACGPCSVVDMCCIP